MALKSGKKKKETIKDGKKSLKETQWRFKSKSDTADQIINWKKDLRKLCKMQCSTGGRDKNREGGFLGELKNKNLMN